MTTLWVPGVPAPKGSGRAVAIPIGPKCPHCGVKPTRAMFVAGSGDSGKKALEAWGKAVRSQIANVEPINGPVTVFLEFVMPRPASRKKDEWHTTYPDLDKLTRATLDAIGPLRKGRTQDLSQPHAFGNDSAIVEICAAKIYETPGETGPGYEPGVAIQIRKARKGEVE